MLLPSALCQEPVRIGIVTELTGKNALAGQQARRGSQLAVAEINRAGGIHGRRFEALLEDSASNNAGAVSALNKLAGRRRPGGHHRAHPQHAGAGRAAAHQRNRLAHHDRGHQ